MHNELTKNDIKKMEDEIEYRVQVVRKQALEYYGMAEEAE